MSSSSSTAFADAEKSLQAFVNNGLSGYERLRNYDFGPADRHNVSLLSKYITHRVLFEYDVVQRILAQHPMQMVEKFVQEVFWRIYWKGWLEHRPAVWADYTAFDHSQTPQTPYQQAINGKTGIDCFDVWAAELQNTNYLHNHARMWFASIWIFTLGLPWQAGARFFMQHLNDGDAATNTLSWRWVAGVQTSGKHYLARASNIEQFTDRRFAPARLNETALPIAALQSYDIVPIDYNERYHKKFNKLIVLENDIHLNDKDFYDAYDSVFVVRPGSIDRNVALADPVLDFKTDLVTAFCENCGNAELIDASALVTVAGNQPGFDLVYPHIGDTWDAMRRLRDGAGVQLHPLKRPQDLFCWQFAKKGFFNFKKNIPEIVSFLR
jgi:deoxyribodipyrimidine photo-lyase